MIWSTQKNELENDLQQSSFVSNVHDFINNKYKGESYIKERIGFAQVPKYDLKIDNEAIYQTHPFINTFKDTKVLMLGAGPSSKQIFNTDHYDHVITCNHFFLNNQFLDIDFSMVCLGDEIDLSAPMLNQYLYTHKNTHVCFENRSITPFWQAFCSKYGDRTFFAHSRYHSRIGAVCRIIALLCIFKVKQIDVAGMDGYITKSNKNKYTNIFQPNKPQSDKGKEDEIVTKYDEQYLTFWDYVLHDIGRNVKFVNLGRGYECNFSDKVLTAKLGAEYPNYLMCPEKRAK